jgi:Shugoshin N-terminal coiled-coil region
LVTIVRRKYSRQNKEIARINSTQCIRIRNLENEVSRLLAENLGLREQILRLQTEAESRSSQEVLDHVNAIKSNLEVKLLELGALVTALGDAPPPKRKASAKEGKTVRPSPTQSPDQKNWKNMCTLSEAVGLQDGKLPPILEDKSYPRRTLE